MTQRAANLKTLEFFSIDTISGGYSANGCPNFDTVILRQNTGVPLKSTGFASIVKFYVPKNLIGSFYSTATNWTTYYNAGRVISIDEDTTATVGTAFTPTTTAQGIVSWDQVDLQSYSVGTVDTTTGTITPTHDGRLLIRGLDSNSDIVHVTYIQIGTGFDEEENLK
jgi:hypothetical protein